jgi:hypothetical protein
MQMTDEQRIDEIRGFMKNLQWKCDHPLYKAKVITDFPRYTIFIEPSPCDPDIDAPAVYLIKNDDLLRLSRYLDAFDRGDEIFDDFDGWVAVEYDEDTRNNAFHDLFAALVPYTGPVKIETIEGYIQK